MTQMPVASEAKSPRELVRQPLFVVLVMVVGLTVLHVWFLWARRRGFPLHLDETGYLATALEDAQALTSRGVSGLITFVGDQPLQAPLVPLLTAPIYLVLKSPLASAFATILGFYALLVMASYALARRVLSAWWSVLAAFVVAVAPDAIGHSRIYVFIVPAAALFTASVFCLVRSMALERAGWVFAGAFLLGLTALSRTLMVALVPAPLIAVGVQAIARGTTVRRIALLASAAGAGAAVALLWYVRTFSLVSGYLRGEQYRLPGERVRLPFVFEAFQILKSLQIPLAAALVAALFAGLFSLRKRRARDESPRASISKRVRGVFGTDAAFLLMILVWAAAVLSVADEASGQWLPLLPINVTLVLLLARHVSKRAKRAVVASIVIAGLLMVAVTSSLFRPLGIQRGFFSRGRAVAVIDGRTPFEQLLDSAGFQVGAPGRLPARYRAWPRLYGELTAWLSSYANRRGEPPVVFFRVVHPLLNVNQLRLADRSADYQPPMVTGVSSEIGPDAPFNFIIHMEPPSLSKPHPPLTAFVRSAQQQGFKVVRRLRLPDGHKSAVLWRPFAERRNR